MNSNNRPITTTGDTRECTHRAARHAPRYITALSTCLLPLTALADSGVTLRPTNLPDTFVYTQPNAQFDPISATDKELAEAGFPPRPDARRAPDAYQHWSRFVRRAKFRIENPELHVTNIEHRPATGITQSANPVSGSSGNGISAASAPTYTSASPNWSGYVIEAPYGTFMANGAETVTEFVVPVVQARCNSIEYMAWWTGFDGWTPAGSNDVLQAGIYASATCINIFGLVTSYSTSYSAIYQWHPNPSTTISNLPINPGDDVLAFVWYSTTAPHGHAYIANLDAQQGVSLGFNPPAYPFYLGNTVEWIAENPQVNGSYSKMGTYHLLPSLWNYAVVGNTEYTPSSSPAGTIILNVTMDDASGNSISQCSLFGAQEAIWCWN